MRNHKLFCFADMQTNEKEVVMDLTLTRNFNQAEKVAMLKLMIKIASSDGEISDSEKATLNEYLQHSKLKINENFLQNTKSEDVGQIVSVFESKANLQRAKKLAHAYAEIHGVDPDFEGAMLEAINISTEVEKKNIHFSLKRFLKELFMEFGYLWGKQDINPKMRQVYAFVFTLIACSFGVFYNAGIIIKNTKVAPFDATHVICALLMYGALCFRGYLPKPKNIRTILFTCANVFLFTLIAMHSIGISFFGKLTNFYIVAGLILLLWLGIKEILGFVLIAFFIWFGINILLVSSHLAWRAFPFIFFSFMGISFQSGNFFDDFGNITNSLFKKPKVDKQLVKESLEIAGQQTMKAAKTSVQAGVTAAKLYAGTV